MTASTESSKRFVSSQDEMRQTQQVHEESVREMEQIRHTNATLDMTGSDSFRAQTEQAAIKIVTPFYKLGEKPGAEVQLGSSVADLSAKFAQADSDYKAERSAEHFRMQIIEPKVISHAHIPAHTTRDYARRHLITDFPSLHGKRSFIDLEAIEQRKLRQQRKLPEAGDRDRDLDKFLKVREEKEQWKTPWPAPKPDDESLRELDRLRQNIDQLQKASMRRSKSLNELRPVKTSKPEQHSLPPLLPSRHKIVESNPSPNKRIHRWRSQSAKQRHRRRRCHTVTEGEGWQQESVCSSETTEIETDKESWDSVESGDDQEQHEQTKPHDFGGSDFFYREARSARSRPRSTLFGLQPEDIVPPLRCRNDQQPTRLNGTETKPVPNERLVKQVEHKAVQAEEQQYHLLQQVQQQQQPLGRSRDFLLVPREHGADLHEWSSRTVVPPPMERHHLAPAAEGISSSTASLPSPPKSILRQPQQRHQHQYTMERRGNEPGHYWEDRGEIGIAGGDADDDAEEQRALYEAMQHNLALHCQPSPRPDLYPSAPFNGPFFRLHEVSPDGRSSRPLNALPLGAEIGKTAPITTTFAPQYQTLPPMSPRRGTTNRTSASAVSHGMTTPPPPPPAPPPPPPPGWAPRQPMEHGPVDNKTQQRDEQGGLVVVWPPFPDQDQDTDQQQRQQQQQQYQSCPKHEVPTPKNVRRDFPEEYARQERMQAEAERQRAERNACLREKQLKAVKLQQEQLSRLTTPLHQQASPADTGIGVSEPENATVTSANRPSTSHSQTQLLSPSVAAVRVYEARPVAAGNATMTAAYDPRFAAASDGVAYDNNLLHSPLAGDGCGVTWRRTYVVDSDQVDERNEILTSEERLARDRFDIDMLRRREQFIEKPEQPVEIRRTGKRWQPPPEKPYRWPTPSTVSVPVEDYGPISVQINGTAADEHRWVPVVRQPTYKVETRDFVPDEPEQQIKGHGAGPLDDVARRQTAGVIMPSPDGSHRPKAEFDGARKPPAGGFIPHAPNVVRRARTRALRAEETISSGTDPASSRRQRHTAACAPATRVRHASAAPSTATRSVWRHESQSEDDHYDDGHGRQQRHIDDWEAAPATPPRRQRRQTTVVTIDNASRAPSSDQRTMLHDRDQGEGVLCPEEEEMVTERHTSTVVTLGPMPRTDVRRKIRAIEVRDRKERSRSAIARARADRSQSPAAQRAQERMRQLTQASPTPAAYEHARKYVPPALAPGHGKSGTSTADGVMDIPRRHAHRMADAVQREASAHAHNREPLAATLATPHQFRRRSTTTSRRPLRADSLGHDRDAPRTMESPPSGRVHDCIYSTVRPIGDRVPSAAAMHMAPLPRGWTTERPPPTDGEPRPIPKAELPEIKLEPSESPMHPHYKEHIRDLLDSRSSSTSAHRLQQESRHSGYVTDTSSSMWQFNASSSFSPRSLVNVNSAHTLAGPRSSPEGMLLRVRTSMGAATSSSESHASTSSQHQQHQSQNGVAKGGFAKGRAIVKVEAPPPIVRRSPVRREVVEVRREVVKAPAIKHTVHRVEEKKRTEEVERRVIRKERRHKSRRMHRSHHSSSGGAHQEYQYGSWGGGSRGGYRSSSASRASRGAYLNGYSSNAAMEHHLPITYEGGGGRSMRSGAGFDSSASDRYYAGGGGTRQQNGFTQQHHTRYGSLSDSLRHGDLKYAPNGELRQNGTAGGGNVKAHRVHKAHSTRDVFYRGGDDSGSHYATFNRRAEPFVEFPPTLDRRSEWAGPEPPPHRRVADAADEFSGGRALQKARSYTDWEDGGHRGGPVGHANVYDDDMARLESEFRDARLMRIPGNMDEKEQYHREIPGGYEAYSRETKAHADHRKIDGDHATHPGDFRRESQRP